MFFLYNQNGIEVEFQVYKKFNDVYNYRSAIALESGEKVDIFENFQFQPRTGRINVEQFLYLDSSEGL